MIVKHKNNLIFASTITGSALLATLTAFFYLHTSFYLTIWVCVFGVFLPFFSFGCNRFEQLSHILGYTLITFVALSYMLVISLLDEPYYSICRALLIFACLCSHRYFTGNKILSVFLTVFVILFTYLYPHLETNALLPTLIAYSGGLTLALITTTIMVLLLPRVIITRPPPDKSSYVIKQALRITIIITVIFAFGYLIPVTNTTWICFSALVISESDFWSSSIKALERGLGTVIGAVLGALIAHYLFRNYPSTRYLSFVLIFFTYYYIRRSYAIGIALATIWITASFYILKPTMNIDQFIIARVIDTLIGIGFGLFGELFIFPKETPLALMKKLRKKIHEL